MGEYAEYALSGAMRSGYVWIPPNNRSEVSCTFCRKTLFNKKGLEQHQKAKHPLPKKPKDPSHD